MYEVTLIFKNNKEVEKGVVALKNLFKTLCSGRERCITGNGMEGELTFYSYDASTELIRNAPNITYSTLDHYFSYTGNFEIYYELFSKVCSELKPVYATLGAWEIPESILGAPCEYGENPYIFCIDGNFTYEDYGFFISKEMEKQISRIKKYITDEELMDIIKRNTFKSFISGNGIGCLKSTPQHPKYGSDFIYPSYFVRKELKKRGLNLGEGLSEKFSKELGIK